MEILVDTKLKVSQQCVLSAKKANDVLGCIRQNIVSRLAEVILPLCFVLLTLHLESCVHFWAPQYERDMDIPGRVHRRATMIIRDWSTSPVKRG